MQTKLINYGHLLPSHITKYPDFHRIELCVCVCVFLEVRIGVKMKVYIEELHCHFNTLTSIHEDHIF